MCLPGVFTGWMVGVLVLFYNPWVVIRRSFRGTRILIDNLGTSDGLMVPYPAASERSPWASVILVIQQLQSLGHSFTEVTPGTSALNIL